MCHSLFLRICEVPRARGMLRTVGGFLSAFLGFAASAVGFRGLPWKPGGHHLEPAVPDGPGVQFAFLYGRYRDLGC